MPSIFKIIDYWLQATAILCLRKGTPLASRVAQGVSGPSSSCVWNPRHPLPGPSPGRSRREGASASWAGPWPARAHPARGPVLGGTLRWLQGASPHRAQVIQNLPEPEIRDPETTNEPEGTGLGAQPHQSLSRGEGPSPWDHGSPGPEPVLKNVPLGSPSHRDTVAARWGLMESGHAVCAPGGRSWEPLGPSPL